MGLLFAARRFALGLCVCVCFACCFCARSHTRRARRAFCVVFLRCVCGWLRFVNMAVFDGFAFCCAPFCAWFVRLCLFCLLFLCAQPYEKSAPRVLRFFYRSLKILSLNSSTAVTQAAALFVSIVVFSFCFPKKGVWWWVWVVLGCNKTYIAVRLNENLSGDWQIRALVC